VVDDRERTLAAHADAPTVRGPGDTSAPEPPTVAAASAAGEKAGGAVDERIGPYRLVRKLAEGGMGEVWLGAQHEPLRRTVAVKVIKRGLDTGEFVARFASERQALALMDHPCIAKVIDAGTTRRGRPYFAMEYVDGEPILAWCDRHRLTVDDRLALFVKVCQGVQHAHQKAIIHRDLKPSNVLVTEHDGEATPKIIDFGVAKALGGELTGHTLQTNLGQIVGTLDYMSPEQADLGDGNVDTRTDVYALGVLLFELLAGRRPLESATLAGTGLVEILRLIREDEAVRPSARLQAMAGEEARQTAAARATDPGTLSRRLRSDLDWIVLRALAKDRGQRYATAHELADDIGRHLRNEPVLAGPPTRRYRARKFVRRHRVWVAGSAVALVLVLAGIAGTSLGLVRARQAERVALTEAETARQVSGFLEDMFEVSDPDRARGQTITAREILDSGAERVRAQLEGQPATQARLMHTIGRVYQKLGLYAAAERQLGDALALRQTLPANVIATSRIEVARNRVDLAELYGVQARYDEAADLLREAMSALGADGREERLQLADAAAELGGVLRRQGRYEEAEPLYRQALEIRREVLGDDHPAVADSYNSQAILAYYRGDWPRVERLFSRALEIRERVLGPDHPDVAQTLNNLGLLHQAQDAYSRAVPLYTRAAAIWEKALGPDHARLALVLNNLGLAYQEQGDLEAAAPLFERALAIRESALGPDNPDVAQTLYNLANLQRDRGDLATARPLYRRALAIREASLGPDHADVGWTITARAGLDAAAGDLEQAIAGMVRGLDVLESALGGDFPELAEEHERLAGYLRRADRLQEAAARERRADAIRSRASAAGDAASR
jgi:serine/threonine protein kinase/tetratricopeptide (TPR) repeat protein